MANASNDYLKREKLWHWPPAAAAAMCLGRYDRMRERGERDGQRHQGGFVWISPTVIILIIGRHKQHCTDTCDGQILKQMQVLVYGGTSSNVIVQKVKDNRHNVP